MIRLKALLADAAIQSAPNATMAATDRTGASSSGSTGEAVKPVSRVPPTHHRVRAPTEASASREQTHQSEMAKLAPLLAQVAVIQDTVANMKGVADPLEKFREACEICNSRADAGPQQMASARTALKNCAKNVIAVCASARNPAILAALKVRCATAIRPLQDIRPRTLEQLRRKLAVLEESEDDVRSVLIKICSVESLPTPTERDNKRAKIGPEETFASSVEEFRDLVRGLPAWKPEKMSHEESDQYQWLCESFNMALAGAPLLARLASENGERDLVRILGQDTVPARFQELVDGMAAVRVQAEPTIAFVVERFIEQLDALEALDDEIRSAEAERLFTSTPLIVLDSLDADDLKQLFEYRNAPMGNAQPDLPMFGGNYPWLCTTARPPQGSYRSQSWDYSCGASSLMMVAKHLGVTILPSHGGHSMWTEEIPLELTRRCEGRIYQWTSGHPKATKASNEWRFSMPSKMISCAQHLGLEAKMIYKPGPKALAMKVRYTREYLKLLIKRAIVEQDSDPELAPNQMAIMIVNGEHYVVVNADGTVKDPDDCWEYASVKDMQQHANCTPWGMWIVITKPPAAPGEPETRS
jgi:hypothetical protein